MKYFYLVIFLSFIAISSCNNDRNSASESVINGITDYWNLIQDSQNHHDYIRFLNDFPDSEYFDTAISRYIKFKKKFCDTVPPPAWHCTRNCIKIEIDSTGSILFENDSLNLIDLKSAVLHQLINPDNHEDLPEKVDVFDNEDVARIVSKGQIYVVTRLENLSNLKKIVIELKKAIEDYKGYLSNEWYAKSINNLSELELRNIESTIRTKYFFDNFDFYPMEIVDRLVKPSEIY